MLTIIFVVQKYLKMKRLVMRFLVLLSAIMLISITGCEQSPPSVRQVKLEDFELQSSSQIKASGEVISTSDYISDVYWFPVKVP